MSYLLTPDCASNASTGAQSLSAFGLLGFVVSSLVTTKMTLAHSSCANTSRRRTNAVKYPRRRNRIGQNVLRGFLDAEVLLSRPSIVVLDKNLALLQIEMLVEKMEGESVHFAMAEQHFADFPHALKISF
jgi:hypothetical protein